jgi:hypothetical protein
MLWLSRLRLLYAAFTGRAVVEVLLTSNSAYSTVLAVEITLDFLLISSIRFIVDVADFTEVISKLLRAVRAFFPWLLVDDKSNLPSE